MQTNVILVYLAVEEIPILIIRPITYEAYLGIIAYDFKKIVC